MNSFPTFEKAEIFPTPRGGRIRPEYIPLCSCILGYLVRYSGRLIVLSVGLNLIDFVGVLKSDFNILITYCTHSTGIVWRDFVRHVDSETLCLDLVWRAIVSVYAGTDYLYCYISVAMSQ